MSNGTDRWRGQVDAELAAIGRRMDAYEKQCEGCQKRQEGATEHLRDTLEGALDRLRLIEVRLGFVAGGAALVGALVPWAITRLTGG